MDAGLVGRHPLVHPDPRHVDLVGARGDVGLVRHQTFWIAALPSNPLGRSSMTTIRMPNTIACWNVDEMYPVANASARPISRPPSTAPGRLPMPPTTAAVNAKRPAWKPMYGNTC